MAYKKQIAESGGAYKKQIGESGGAGRDPVISRYTYLVSRSTSSRLNDKQVD